MRKAASASGSRNVSPPQPKSSAATSSRGPRRAAAYPASNGISSGLATRWARRTSARTPTRSTAEATRNAMSRGRTNRARASVTAPALIRCSPGRERRWRRWSSRPSTPAASPAAEDPAGPLAPAVRRPHVPGDRGVLVRRDAQRVVGGDVLGEPVDGPLRLPGEGAEEPVPQDQDAAEVPVEIAALGGVVHAVVGGRVQYVLERPGQLVDPFGVHPELVDEIGRRAERQRRRMHTAGDERHVERPDGQRGPGLAQRGGEVELPAGVVDHMAGPEDPDDVVAAVGPVVEEVLREQHQQDRPPQDGNAERGQLVDRGVDGHDGHFPQQIEHETAEPHGDAGDGVLGLVPGGVLIGVDAGADHFDNGEQDEGRYGPQHDIGQVRLHASTVERWVGRGLDVVTNKYARRDVSNLW